MTSRASRDDIYVQYHIETGLYFVECWNCGEAACTDCTLDGAKQNAEAEGYIRQEQGYFICQKCLSF